MKTTIEKEEIEEKRSCKKCKYYRDFYCEYFDDISYGKYETCTAYKEIK